MKQQSHLGMRRPNSAAGMPVRSSSIEDIALHASISH